MSIRIASSEVSLINKNAGIKVAEYRDLIAGNRRLAMLLLDYFEKIKVVENQDNVRFLKS